MGMTLAEKIISEHAGHDVKAGELVIADVDVTAVQDGTGPLTVQEFKKLGLPRLKNPERPCLTKSAKRAFKHAYRFKRIFQRIRCSFIRRWSWRMPSEAC